jgi:UDP-N-acetylglucosamine 2-epimerase (non-hydrolysing)
MKKIKVMTVVGTRPEIIRLSRTIHLLEKNTDHILVHTGQNYDYELNEIFFNEMSIKKPDVVLKVAGKSSSETIGNVLIQMDKTIKKFKPDAVLLLGDTNSCMAAIPAKRRKIPCFHMEAGNRCFDFRVPEEINRRIVDHTADINMTYSSIARQYLINEGINPETIIKTGSPLYEVISFYNKKIISSDILSQLSLQKNKYFLVSFHREENIDNKENLIKILNSINNIAEIYGNKIIVSTHPRTRKRIEQLKYKLSSKVILHKPFGYFDYMNLQMNSSIVLSDSGTITEEASILNFLALNIRESHERPEGMEEGAVIMTGLNKSIILNSIEYLLTNKTYLKSNHKIVDDYLVPNVSSKVLKIIFSYKDYVLQNTWKITS